jgi:hypothetical protein
MTVHYPVALDSDYAIWQAFANRFWPAIYIADSEGRIRHHQFGEGGYAECEMVIQRLLRESGRDTVPHDLVSVAPDGLEAPADWASLGSPETYLGYEQARGFASPADAVLDQTHACAAPDRLNLNHWALAGDWTLERRATVLDRAEGRILFRFHARDVHLVMGPVHGRHLCRSAYSSMVSLPATLTASTPTNTAAEPSINNGSISSFASQDQLTTAPSRSPSSHPTSKLRIHIRLETGPVDEYAQPCAPQGIERILQAMRSTEPPTIGPPKTYEQGLGERRAANLPISATWCRTPGTHADCEGDVGEVAVPGVPLRSSRRRRCRRARAAALIGVPQGENHIEHRPRLLGFLNGWMPDEGESVQPRHDRLATSAGVIPESRVDEGLACPREHPVVETRESLGVAGTGRQVVWYWRRRAGPGRR